MRAGVPAGVPFSCHLHKNIGLFLSYLLLRLEVIQGGGKQKPRRRRGGRAACHGGRRGASGRAGHWDARHAPRLSSGREQAAGHRSRGPVLPMQGGRRAPWGGPRRTRRTWAATEYGGSWKEARLPGNSKFLHGAHLAGNSSFQGDWPPTHPTLLTFPEQ